MQRIDQVSTKKFRPPLSLSRNFDLCRVEVQEVVTTKKMEATHRRSRRRTGDKKRLRIDEDKGPRNFLLANFLLVACGKLPSCLRKELDDLNPEWMNHVAECHDISVDLKMTIEEVLKYAHFRFSDEDETEWFDLIVDTVFSG